jgi:hypothetical protein
MACVPQVNLEHLENSLQCLLQEIVSDAFHLSSQSGITSQHCEQLLEHDDFQKNEVSSVTLFDQFYDMVFYYLILHQVPVSYSKLRNLLPKSSQYMHSMVAASTLFSQEEREKICSIPLKPFYIELAKVVYIWITTGDEPITFRRIDGLREIVDDSERLKKLTPTVLKWAEEFRNSSSEHQKYLWAILLEELGIRGILTLFRLRKTEGSVDLLPPSLMSLFTAFNELHDENTKLTVGARALSKHSRRSSEGFWGKDNVARADKIIPETSTITGPSDFTRFYET